MPRVGARAACSAFPRGGDRDEAVVLFTSGSSGEPKGVVLSHRNLLGNVSQFALMLNLSRGDSVLACLPFFHSFGCTVTLWFPLIEGVRSVTYPNPLEIAKNAELIERYNVTLFLHDADFSARHICARPSRRSSRACSSSSPARRSCRTNSPTLSRSGSERSAARLWPHRDVAGRRRESARASNASGPGDAVQPTNRLGSVGKLAPGIAAEIRDPETDAPLSLHETGMLWLRGPNIFEGYLDDPKRTAEVLVDRWFKTGDLARFDEDGFLFIEGRLSRFSKIGGEMVPHETVETKVARSARASRRTSGHRHRPACPMKRKARRSCCWPRAKSTRRICAKS